MKIKKMRLNILEKRARTRVILKNDYQVFKVHVASFFSVFVFVFVIKITFLNYLFILTSLLDIIFIYRCIPDDSIRHNIKIDIATLD